jgi:WASH complex subunit strumpellin
MDFDEYFYDENIPMPPKNAAHNEEGTVNFMGRLLKALQSFTDPRTTLFLENPLGFYEIGTGKDVLTMKTLGLLYRCIGVSGLNGLDK